VRTSGTPFRNLDDTKELALETPITKPVNTVSKLDAHERRMLASPDGQISLTDPDSRSMASRATQWAISRHAAGEAACSQFRCSIPVADMTGFGPGG
jgi:hypothetical protein